MPIVSPDGTVYAASLDNNLYAIDPDGTQKWAYTTGKYAWSVSLAFDGSLYVGCEQGGLYAVASDGTQKWTYVTDWVIRSQAAIGADGTVYVTSFDSTPSGSEDDNALLAFNPDGTLKWSFTSKVEMCGPAIGDDGTLYVGSGNHLYAFGSWT
jgi:outer membrane protein assembly factor BamB